MGAPRTNFTNPANPPSLNDLKGYSVNRPDQVEVIWQPFYDFQTYGTAGATQFTFFQTPVGQGGSTKATTNMQAAGQFPRPWEFLCTGLQVWFDNGAVISRTAAAATIMTNSNDVDAVMNGAAFLDFFIGSKSYLSDSPLAKFPPSFRLDGETNIAGTYAAGTQVLIDYMTTTGRYYSITPVRIPANQNFNVTLNFPTAIAVTTAGKIGVILDGFLYRLSQ